MFLPPRWTKLYDLPRKLDMTDRCNSGTYSEGAHHFTDPLACGIFSDSMRWTRRDGIARKISHLQPKDESFGSRF